MNFGPKSCFVVVVLISYRMHDLFLTGYDSMLAATLITIVGAKMVHVFCPGGCLRTNAGSLRSPHFFVFAGGAKTGFARKNGRISSVHSRTESIEFMPVARPRRNPFGFIFTICLCQTDSLRIVDIIKNPQSIKIIFDRFCA